MCLLHHAAARVVQLPLCCNSDAKAGTLQGQRQQAHPGTSTTRSGGKEGSSLGPAGSHEVLHQSQTSPVRALCIELVGDRFLRKQVRVLVSTAVREARAAGRLLPAAAAADGTSLEQLVAVGDRSLTAHPAPAVGLCFSGAGYEPWHSAV